jgi:methylmalonyl-CoA/ethylmalonyl-CoA epimerase
MKAQRIDHVAIAVKDLEAAVTTYQHNFGLDKVREGAVPSLGIRNAFLQIGDAQIELITPLSDQGPVADFVA